MYSKISGKTLTSNNDFVDYDKIESAVISLLLLSLLRVREPKKKYNIRCINSNSSMRIPMRKTDYMTRVRSVRRLQIIP